VSHVVAVEEVEAAKPKPAVQPIRKLSNTQTETNEKDVAEVETDEKPRPAVQPIRKLSSTPVEIAEEEKESTKTKRDVSHVVANLAAKEAEAADARIVTQEIAFAPDIHKESEYEFHSVQRRDTEDVAPVAETVEHSAVKHTEVKAVIASEEHKAEHSVDHPHHHRNLEAKPVVAKTEEHEAEKVALAPEEQKHEHSVDHPQQRREIEIIPSVSESEKHVDEKKEVTSDHTAEHPHHHVRTSEPKPDVKSTEENHSEHTGEKAAPEEHKESSSADHPHHLKHVQATHEIAPEAHKDSHSADHVSAKRASDDDKDAPPKSSSSSDTASKLKTTASPNDERDNEPPKYIHPVPISQILGNKS
jgi:hypothetical protein